MIESSLQCQQCMRCSALSRISSRIVCILAVWTMKHMAKSLPLLLLLQERETQLGARPFRLLERSVFSDRMVFVRAVHEAKWMSDLELNIYDSW